MHPAIVSGIVTGDAPVSYWLIVSLSFITVPEVFVKVNLTHYIFLFVSKVDNTHHVKRAKIRSHLTDLSQKS